MAVFNTNTGKPTVVRAGKAIVKVNGATLMALNVSLTYQRPVEIVPTIGEKRVLSIGEGQGQFSAQTVLSSDSNVVKAMGLNDDGCDPFSMTIEFQGATCTMSGKTVTAHNCVASAVSLDAQGGRGYIANGVTVTFTALTMN